MNNSLTSKQLLKERLVNGALHIDASSLEGRFMSCPREFYYYALRKREAVRDFIGRDFGKFMHSMLHDHYSGLSEQEVLLCAAKRWADKPCTTNPDEYRNLDFALQVYQQYREAYRNDPCKVVRTETPIALPITTLHLLEDNYKELNVPVIYTGRVDLLVEMPDGKLWIMDHKTTSIGGETFWKTWINSSQMHGYVWAVEQLVNHPIEGYIINALFLRKPTKTGKSIELLQQRYPVGDDAKRHTATLETWRKNTIDLIHTIGDNIAMDTWPMHTNACVRKYGVCEYHDTCRLSPGRDTLLNTNLYQDVTWSPLD